MCEVHQIGIWRFGNWKAESRRSGHTCTPQGVWLESSPRNVNRDREPCCGEARTLIECSYNILLNAIKDKAAVAQMISMLHNVIRFRRVALPKCSDHHNTHKHKALSKMG